MSYRKQVIASSRAANVFGGGSLATRLGPFVFFSGRVAARPDSGAPIRDHRDVAPSVDDLMVGQPAPDSREGPILGQTWAVYEQAGAVLEELGGRRHDFVHQVVSFKDGRYLPIVMRARGKFLAGNPLGPATLATFKAFGLRHAVVALDAIGYLTDPELPLVPIMLPGWPYMHGLRVGQLLVYSNIVPYRFELRRGVLAPEDLPPELADRVTSGVGIDRWELAVATQAEFVLDKLSRQLAADGGTLADVARLGVYTTDARALHVLERIVERTFAGDPPAVTFHVVEQLATETFFVALEPFVLLRNGPWRREVVRTPIEEPVLHAPAAVRAGPLLFVSGLVGMPGAHRASDSPATEDAEGPAATATASALERLGRILRSQGGSLDDVLKLHVSLTSMRDYPAVERVVRQTFAKDPPAITAVELSALPVRGAAVQIEAIAG